MTWKCGLPAKKNGWKFRVARTFEAFQAMRAGIRFKRDQSIQAGVRSYAKRFSGLATPRIMVALLENNLKEDGTIEIPEVLRSYCGFNNIINI
jgi:seryl-tRNA synthetase